MTHTTAIILAAGVGSRLRPLTDDIPKCLVSLGSETILARMVRLLTEAGVGELVVSTGFEATKIHGALGRSPIPVRFVHNPDYASTQNVVSLWRALAVIERGAVIKLDGDVVFDGGLLARIMVAPGDAQVLVDDAEAPPAEAMKVVTEGGFVRRFGKGLDARAAAGESIGIERFNEDSRGVLGAALGRAVAAGRRDVYYEDVYNDLVGEGLAMACVSTQGCAWTEVDDLADLARARTLFGA
jgi:choline kinase